MGDIMSNLSRLRHKITENNEAACKGQIIFYPEGYKSYGILISILSSFIIIIISTILVLILSENTTFKLSDYLLIVVIMLGMYSVPIYGFVLIWKLSSKKIKLVLTDGEIIFNAVTKTKRIKVTDIEVIKMADSGIDFRRIDCVIIKVNKHRDKKYDSKIVIPVVWFGKENLSQFIEKIKKQKLNKNIIIDLNL